MTNSVPLERSFLHYLSASETSYEYEIQVQLPRSYDNAEKQYPVFYMLDADLSFAMATSLFYGLAFVPAITEIQEVINVGITYRDKDMANVVAQRSRDMSPTKNKQLIDAMSEYLPCHPIEEHSGGADKFLRFLRNDLFPFIDSTYRTDPSLRVGQGHSFGGLFMLYALFNEPDTFQKYMVSSPSIWWDDKAILKIESAYADNHGDLNADVYITSGSEEYSILEGLSIIVPLLQAREYANLKLRYDVYNNHTHMSVIAPAFVEGLRLLLAIEEK